MGDAQHGHMCIMSYTTCLITVLFRWDGWLLGPSQGRVRHHKTDLSLLRYKYDEAPFDVCSRIYSSAHWTYSVRVPTLGLNL